MGQYFAFSTAVVLLYATIHVLSYLQWTNARRRKMRELGCKDPPGYQHKDPLLGLDLYFDNIKAFKEKRFLENSTARFDKYGQTFKALSMGQVAVHTNDPKNYQAVHALNFSDYGVQPLRRAPTLPFLGEGVFTMDGPFWEHSRALIRPTFTRSNVANLPSFEVHLRAFFKIVPTDRSTVDLKPLLYKLFLDTSTEFLFGESMNTLSPEASFATREFLQAFHYAQRGMGMRIRLGRFRAFHRDRKWQESIKIAHAFAEKYVERALEYRKAYLKGLEDGTDPNPEDADRQKRYVLLQELAKETDDRVELRSQIIHVFLAGHDSTAITISNAIFHLSRHQEKWRKLRKEILAASDAPPTFESLKNMHYLQYIIRETLRLHPVEPTDTRLAYRDTVLPAGGGLDGTSPILISAGQTIIFNTYALHRRRENWGEDVEAFRPERWKVCRPGWHYQPFGGGPRMCPGQNLALTEAAYVLARMAQEWTVLECRDEVLKWVEEMKITASSANGVLVGVGKA